MNLRVLPSLTIAVLVLATTAASQQLVPAGPVTEPHEQTAGSQTHPAVSPLGDGSFFLVWYSSDGLDREIHWRRYDADGAPMTIERGLSVSTPIAPRAASLPTGETLIVWPDDDGSNTGIWAQLLNSAGELSGASFQINSYTTDEQTNPDVAATAADEFVVVWDDGFQYEPTYGVSYRKLRPLRGRRLDKTGAFVHDDEPLTTGAALEPRIESHDLGFIIVWEEQWFMDVHVPRARSFDLDALALTEEIVVSDDTSWTPDPDIAVDADGDFVVTWSRGEIFARSFDSSGVATSAVFQVNDAPAGSQVLPIAERSPSGDLAVSWQDSPTPLDPNVALRHFGRDDTAAGPAFLANAFTTSFQHDIDIGSLSGGRFVVTWTSDGSDGVDDDGRALQLRLYDVSLRIDGFESGDFGGWD